MRRPKAAPIGGSCSDAGESDDDGDCCSVLRIPRPEALVCIILFCFDFALSSLSAIECCVQITFISLRRPLKSGAIVIDWSNKGTQFELSSKNTLASWRFLTR